VRIGNGAADQLRLDIYGEALDGIAKIDSCGLQLAYQGWKTIASVIDWLCDHWDQPDEGVWETRGGRQDFTYGRVQCWVALDRAIRLAEGRGRPGDFNRWRSARDTIYQQVMTRGWNTKRDAFTQHYAIDVLDSSLLVMPLVGFVSPLDPMWLWTLDAMDHELVSDSLVYRYNPGACPDGQQGKEGTFSRCTFWCVEALAISGRLEDAELVFEKMRHALAPIPATAWSSTCSPAPACGPANSPISRPTPSSSSERPTGCASRSAALSSGPG
jgi:GH15 family glucan-1,4-alpha-glucosidase